MSIISKPCEALAVSDDFVLLNTPQPRLKAEAYAVEPSEDELSLLIVTESDVISTKSATPSEVSAVPSGNSKDLVTTFVSLG